MSTRTMWFGAALAVSGCGANGGGSVDAESAAADEQCQVLDPSLNWHGENRERIDRLLAESGECGGSGQVGEGAPLALFDWDNFDWDNTVVKNDIGSATAYWLIRNDKISQPPGRDWASISRYLTPAGGAALTAACGTETPAGQPLRTSANLACADEIVAVFDEKTAAGEASFAGYDHRRTKAGYAWAVQLMCHAYDNADGKWLVNPMYLEPKAQLGERYPCASTAFTAPGGAGEPVRRADGTVIADQADSVY